MKKFIAYNKNNFNILGYIENQYTTIQETSEIFRNFENYDVIEADKFEIPENYEKYKVTIEEGLLTRIELIPDETNTQEEV